jgi:hypothetical protein
VDQAHFLKTVTRSRNRGVELGSHFGVKSVVMKVVLLALAAWILLLEVSPIDHRPALLRST